MKLMVPDMTAVSKPKSRPPKAATMEIRTTYPFIVIKKLKN
jgi:hypothetical protein